MKSPTDTISPFLESLKGKSHDHRGREIIWQSKTKRRVGARGLSIHRTTFHIMPTVEDIRRHIAALKRNK